MLTGATGYVGGRLAPRLAQSGYEVDCLARSPRKLESRDWIDCEGVRVVEGDVCDTAQLTERMRGCDAAYYLVHSMGKADDFTERDRELARSFAHAARDAGIKRIIYLGGLGGDEKKLSTHLASRREVERVLASTGVPTTIFRAGVVIGSGSASFEVLRYVIERLPIMLTPKWVRTECQPIAVRDVLGYLIEALRRPETMGETIEIGGPDVLPYQDLMHMVAHEVGLRRRIIIPVPVLSPTLSSLWLGLITPVTPSIARPLIGGLKNRVVVSDDSAERLIPRDNLPVREAVRRAIEKTRSASVETIWSAAGVIPGDPDWAGGTVFRDEREREIDAPPEAVYRAVCRVGGGHGWYAVNILWKIRGLMDKIAGGPGLRRGRRHPEEIGYGEALDFWRVIGVERDRSLALRAEMKLPGIAELRFRIAPLDGGARSRLDMRARFLPKGLLGILYWYAVLPAHHFVFTGMLNGIRRTALRLANEPDPSAAERC